MKFWPFIVLAAMPCSLQSQSPKSQEWAVVEKVCGRVTDSEFTRAAWSTSYVAGAGRRKKADVYLYRREEKKKCCAKQVPIAGASTGTDGSFEFKGVAPGQYWAMVVVGKKKYKLAVTVDPSAKGAEDCSARTFQINKNELQLFRMITFY